MTTTTLADSHPDDLPVWARLALAAQGVAFTKVDFWEREEDTQICAYLKPYGHVLLIKR